MKTPVPPNEGRGWVAADERGVLGVVVDHYAGVWRGFVLADRTAPWASRAPAWHFPVNTYLRGFTDRPILGTIDL